MRVIKWVLRRGRDVASDFEVRVRFPSVVMEIVGSWGDSRAGIRSEREARRDERGRVVQECGLLVSFICIVADGFLSGGAGGAL